MYIPKKQQLHILATIYLFVIYAIPFFFYLKNEASFFFVFFPLVLTIVNAIFIQKNKQEFTKEDLLDMSVLLKYGMIPFYLIGGGFILSMLIITVIPVPFMAFVSIPVVIITSIFGWFFMVGSAPFALGYLSKAKEEQSLSPVIAMLATIFQFFFVLDVIAVMIACLKEQRWKKTTLCIIGLFILCFLFIFIYFLMGFLRA